MKIQDLMDIIHKLLALPSIKLFMSVIFILSSWIFNGDVEIIYAVFALIAIDTFSGVWIAVKGNSVTSRDFFRSPRKCFVYMIFLIVSRICDKHLPVHITAPVIDAFLVTTETISIFENFAKLGFPVPTFLISKLKVFYENKQS